MDPAIELAARALSLFDPLGALKRIALRDDAHALALRGIAMAQLGDYPKAKKLLGRAATAFGAGAPLERARCLAALGEIALATRDLAPAGRALDEASRLLAQHGDESNVAFTRLQHARRLVLLGRVDEAGAALDALDLARASPRLAAIAALVAADVARRRLRAGEARAWLAKAKTAADATKIASLREEISRATSELAAPVARIVRGDHDEPVALDVIESLATAHDLVIDACHRQVRAGKTTIRLVTRPVLLALAVTLGVAAARNRETHGDAGATREKLIADAFGAARASESLRARLRVEIGRLRKALAAVATIEATPSGFALRPRRGSTRNTNPHVLVVLPPAEGEASALLALLRGGASWSTSALATAIGRSQRTVQRALLALTEAGKVESIGDGRTRRWVARSADGFATTLLLVSHSSRV